MNNPNRRYNSRLEKHLEDQTKKYIIYTVIGVIILIVFLAKFGIPLVLGTSSFFSKDTSSQTGSNNTQNQNTISYIAPPTLDSLPSATKDDHITISGSTDKTYDSIKLYNNNQLVDKLSIESDGKFSHNETLKEGTNNFTAKAMKGNKESDFSNEISIDSHTKAPDLSIDSPSDNATLNKDQNPITVSGSTDPSATVTVNDHQAIIDENGKYTYQLNLQNGGGVDIKVEATDTSGNKTDKQIHITYNP